jgi:hypothetical protein
MCWVNVLNAFDLLVLSRASLEAQLAYQSGKLDKKDTTPRVGSPSLLAKLRFALELPYNYRRINTPWENPRLRTSASASTPQTQRKSKSTFLLHALLTLVISGTIIHLLTLDASDKHLQHALSKLNTSKSVLLPLRHFDAQKLLVQILFTLSFGLVTRAAIVGGHTAAALVAVGALGDDPNSWPPIFEPLGEARSLRRLWGYVFPSNSLLYTSYRIDPNGWY